MKTEEIQAIYPEGSIRPIGKTEKDKEGNIKVCLKCKTGILYHNWDNGKVQCTKCDYCESKINI